MTQPPSPLVSSGRRPSAGPGRQFARPLHVPPPIAGLVVVVLAATLVFSPPLIALLSMIDAGRVNAPPLLPNLSFQLVTVLTFGRALIALVLAGKVARASELE